MMTLPQCFKRSLRNEIRAPPRGQPLGTWPYVECAAKGKINGPFGMHPMAGDTGAAGDWQDGTHRGPAARRRGWKKLKGAQDSKQISGGIKFHRARLL
jgi:hypothetical protein